MLCDGSWQAVIVDGHSVEELCKVLSQPRHQPLAVIAKTIKGKGIPGENTHHTPHSDTHKRTSIWTILQRNPIIQFAREAAVSDLFVFVCATAWQKNISAKFSYSRRQEREALWNSRNPGGALVLEPPQLTNPSECPKYTGAGRGRVVTAISGSWTQSRVSGVSGHKGGRADSCASGQVCLSSKGPLVFAPFSPFNSSALSHRPGRLLWQRTLEPVARLMSLQTHTRADRVF